MEYIGLKPIEGVNGKEPTAFTLKTIKELLAEESEKGSEKAQEAAKLLDASEKPAPAPKPVLQQPPHMERAAAAPAPRPMPAAPTPPAAPAADLSVAKPEKPRSLFKRLIGG